MKIYDSSKISHEFTNLDYIKQWFNKTIHDYRDDGLDFYDLKNGYEIEYLGEYEEFIVNYYYYDHDVGYCTNDDIFSGDFGQCVEYIKKQTGIE